LYTFVVQIFRDGFVEEADRGADRLLELYDRAEGVLLLKSLILLRKGEEEEAETLLRECMEKYPDRGVAHTYMARIHDKRGDRERVIDSLRRGLELEPNQEAALLWWVDLMIEEGGKRKAMDELKPFVEKEGAWWPKLITGRLHLEEGDTPAAVRLFSDALEWFRSRQDEQTPPSFDEEVALMTAVTLLSKHGCRDEVISLCDQYWQAEYSTPFAVLDYAQALVDAGRVREAVDRLQQALDFVLPEYVHLVEQKLTELKQRFSLKI
jgi:tetratricopeptide (TPR) repeat protein